MCLKHQAMREPKKATPATRDHLLCDIFGNECPDLHNESDEACLRKCYAPADGHIRQGRLDPPWKGGLLSGVVPMDSWSEAERVPHYTIVIEPMGKPRMTRRDKWLKRGPAVRYRLWKDEFRLQMGRAATLDIVPYEVSWRAYFTMPKRWSKAKHKEMAGTWHRQRPDRDNIDKAILDALFTEDAGVAIGSMEKYWDDGDGARIELWLSWNTPRHQREGIPVRREQK